MSRVAFACARCSIAVEADISCAHVGLGAIVAVCASKNAFSTVPVFRYGAVACVYVECGWARAAAS